MPIKCPRIAARAILLHENRILMVNAYRDNHMNLMCAPGGGVETGTSLPENLKREVFEETGLHINVGDPCLVNEFHDPDSAFHQIDIYFRCTPNGSAKIDPNWRDSEGIVSNRRWVTQEELSGLTHKPDSLGVVAFGTNDAPIYYDPLELILR